VVVSCTALIASCAYFNTVYNAKNYYREGRKLVAHDTLIMDAPSFDKAVEKATSIIVKYPDTRWVDDALFIMGASYYFKGDYSRSLEKLDFLIDNYPGSSFRAEARYFIGLANYKMKRYSASVTALKEVLNDNRFRKKALLLMLYAHYSSDNLNGLYEVTDTLLKRSLRYAERRAVLKLTGMAQFKEERFAAAAGNLHELAGDNARRERPARSEAAYRGNISGTA
jgi:tetratricopeptide (TPR) repeat protein